MLSQAQNEFCSLVTNYRNDLISMKSQHFGSRCSQPVVVSNLKYQRFPANAPRRTHVDSSHNLLCGEIHCEAFISSFLFRFAVDSGGRFAGRTRGPAKSASHREAAQTIRIPAPLEFLRAATIELESITIIMCSRVQHCRPAAEEKRVRVY